MLDKKMDASLFAAVLPAGGLGKRMGASLPKQLLELSGKPIWKYSVETFLSHPRIGCVVLVVPSEWHSHFIDALGDLPVMVTDGGAERWQSVRNGLGLLPAGVEFALVHDVARPMLSPSIIDSVLAQVTQTACIVAKPVYDTVKIVNNGVVNATVDRSTVWLAQTPQAFAVKRMQELYAHVDAEGLGFIPTDEASLLEHFGDTVAVVPGDSWNDKVTTPEDFARFQDALLKIKNES